MDYKRLGHSVYHCQYHIVISTKYRRKVLTGGMEEYLKIKVREVSKYHPEIVFISVNTDQDHLHVLVSIPPKIPVSQVVNYIKANTGRAMRRKFPFLDKVYWGVEGIWSIGYFVSTTGIDAEIIKHYIEYQGVEDSGQAPLEFPDATAVRP